MLVQGNQFQRSGAWEFSTAKSWESVWFKHPGNWFGSKVVGIDVGLKLVGVSVSPKAVELLND